MHVAFVDDDDVFAAIMDAVEARADGRQLFFSSIRPVAGTARTDVDLWRVRRTSAGRWGVPDDFAGIAVFLAAPASDFVTGAAITVDGGYSVQG